MRTDLQGLGSFKLQSKGSTKSSSDSEVLSKEQTLIFAKVLMRYDFKIRAEVRADVLKERRNLYQSQTWPYYETSHDRLLTELLKASKDLEMAAATSVGISRKNWQDSLSLHFSYP